MGTFKGRCALILAAAPETEYGYLKAFLKEQPDCIIACADGGQRHAQAMGLFPDLVVGDFDSSEAGKADVLIRLRPEKDDTDTQCCMRELIRRGCKEITLACATGGRLDHTLGNLSLLEEAKNYGVQCAVLDRQNYVVLHKGGVQQFKMPPCYRYFSIIPLDATLTGVHITGAKYPLQDATLHRSAMISISNEAVASDFTISIKRGRAFVVFSCDKAIK